MVLALVPLPSVASLPFVKDQSAEFGCLPSLKMAKVDLFEDVCIVFVENSDEAHTTGLFVDFGAMEVGCVGQATHSIRLVPDEIYHALNGHFV